MTLSETLRSAVDDRVDLDLSDVHQRVDRRRRRRARARTAGGALGAGLLLVGVVALAAGAGDERPDVMANEGEIPVDEPTTSAAFDPETTTTEIPSTSTTTVAPTTSTEPAPSTTTTEPAPTTEPPPTTTAPASTVLSLRGSYVVGSVPYAGTETCPDMAGGLEGTIAMEDGSTWTRSEHTCFSIRDDVFRGEGTFTLGAPDGSTLTGTSLSIAELPTNGVPYSLEITGGTGAYAGAEGTCDLTVNIVHGSGTLHQRQEGVITCTAAVPPVG
jgi:hypothetical protein